MSPGGARGGGGRIPQAGRCFIVCDAVKSWIEENAVYIGREPLARLPLARFVERAGPGTSGSLMPPARAR
jgi:hypothetical protein